MINPIRPTIYGTRPPHRVSHNLFRLTIPSTMHLRPLALVSLLLPLSVFAQSSTSGSEDLVELSPFSISSDNESGYEAASSLVGTRLATPLIDARTALTVAPVAVSIFKRADAVAIQFVLSHNGDKQQTRNQELYASLEKIQAAVKKIPGLKLEQREVRFTGGDRKLFSLSRGTSTSSFVNLLILADLPADARVVDRVKEVRDLLGGVKLVGQTKYNDGTVGLYLKNSDQYRREILDKIFEDFRYLKKGFDSDFELLPTGLGGKVRVRVAAEGELKLWIDYGFTFRSLREMDADKKS